MGKVIILPETPRSPLSLIGNRAGTCWNSDVSQWGKNVLRGIECINSGHGRVMEFVDVHMVLEGYSARVIREWYTHIGGSPTRLQESTRYLDFNKGMDFIVPPTIEKNEDAYDLYGNLMFEIKTCYRTLTECCKIPKEDAAMVLPMGMATKIVDKRNLRNLVEMSHQRMCTRAYWEYRQLMTDIRNALSVYSIEWGWIANELLEPKCEAIGYCTEKKSCGRKKRKNEQEDICN
jgi:thymidylate synthase (FAD)